MKVMVIDTALGACTAAVTDTQSGNVPGLRHEEMTRGHQERLGGMVRDAVAEAGGFDAVARIGVTVGPGSFTGLRVGLAFAQGLGTALSLPVTGVSTLDALARSVPVEGLVVAAIDARRGQVYLRMFRDGLPISEAEAVAVEDAVARIGEAGNGAGGKAAVIVGSGALILTAQGDLPDAVLHPLVAPLPMAIAALAAEQDVAMYPPRPLYLRAPDATPPGRLPGQPRPTGKRA